MSPVTATKQKTILLIEGDDNYSFFFSKSLQPQFQVIWAHNARQGLALAQAMRPNLILLEIILEGEDGFEVLKKLKSNPITQKIPVAVVTNLAHPEDKNEALHLGACQYLLKNGKDPENLLQTVNSIIGEKVT